MSHPAGENLEIREHAAMMVFVQRTAWADPRKAHPVCCQTRESHFRALAKSASLLFVCLEKYMFQVLHPATKMVPDMLVSKRKDKKGPPSGTGSKI